MTKNFALYACARRAKTLLRSRRLLNSSTHGVIVSRRIRDEATAGEPEVVTCERGNSGKIGSRNMAPTRFLDLATPTSYSTSDTSECLSRTVTKFWRVKIKSRPKYTTTSGLSATFLWRIFRIAVNLTTFRTISGIFENTSGFWILLPVHIFRYVAPSFLIGSMSSRLSAIRQQHGPKYGKKKRPGCCAVQTGSRNMAATPFFDSATPTSYSTSNTSECLSRTVTEF